MNRQRLAQTALHGQKRCAQNVNHPPSGSLDKYVRAACRLGDLSTHLHCPQEYRHVDYLSFQDQEAVQTFVSAWIKSGKQRYGLLYGYYDRCALVVKATTSESELE